ncbi:MAG TPA: cobalt ECF transporter T component CbiQ [Geobacteraceae bacterium]|nr:cobalt ECF transporter T component CbiQ [Geobacteraceae bacterium]
MIPDWLAQENASAPLPPLPRQGRKGSKTKGISNEDVAGCKCKALGAGRKGFVERTIDGAVGFLRDTVLTDAIARRGGLLQALDPRVKIITIIALIVTVSIMRSPVTIWGAYGFTLLLAVASSVSLLFFIKRVWLFIPIFSAVIVIPALFNVVTPGEPLWTVFHLSRSHSFGPYYIPDTITVTRQGVLTALTFTGRVAASVSLAVLLTLTTLWSDLLRALRVLWIPQLFVLILAMSYRYILLLVQTVQNIHVARKSRTLRYGSTGEEQRWVASRIGYLFKRTWVMSLDVHRAMLSRGFSGDIRTLAVFKSRGYDYAWCLFVTATCVLVLVADYRTHYW